MTTPIFLALHFVMLSGKPVKKEVTGLAEGAKPLWIYVSLHITPADVEAFFAASLISQEHSLAKEPGFLTMEFSQSVDDPTEWRFVEMLSDDDAVVQHKNTEHYFTWKAAVADFMATPRTGAKHWLLQ